MNTLILLLIAIAAVYAATWVTVRYVRLLTSDGYGHRPTPPTHYDQSLLSR